MNNLICSEFVNNKWAVEPVFLDNFFKYLANIPNIDNIAAIEINKAASKPKTYTVIDKTAIVKVSGILLKSVPWFLGFFGIEATSYEDIQNQLSAALNDNSVDSINLLISSPGGEVDGLADTADMIYAARTSKKITATVQDLCASAAYWLASQAEIIESNRTAEVGSIGVYTVYLDSSKRAEDMGLKVVLIKSGEHKGVGVPGTEITDKQIEVISQNINSLANMFIDSVARGRSKDRDDIEAIADGRLFMAEKAKKLGMIDSVTNMVNQNSSNSNKGARTMEKLEQEEAQAQQAAELKELEKKTADSERQRMKALQEEFSDDPEYAIKAFTEGKSLEQAKADYCEVLRKKLKAKPADSNAGNELEGAEAIATETTDTGSSGDFMSEARALAKEEKISMTEAMKRVRRDNPKLHASFLEKSRTSGRRLIG